MNQSALAVAVVLFLTACGAPEPPPEPPPPPPDPGLVVKAIQQAEAAIEVAEEPRWYLAQSRGARRSMFIARLEFRLALDAAKEAHDSAPEATATAYQASVAAFEAGVAHNRIYFNPEGDVAKYEIAREERDAAFQAALDAWQQLRNAPVESQ